MISERDLWTNAPAMGHASLGSPISETRSDELNHWFFRPQLMCGEKREEHGQTAEPSNLPGRPSRPVLLVSAVHLHERKEGDKSGQ